MLIQKMQHWNIYKGKIQLHKKNGKFMKHPKGYFLIKVFGSVYKVKKFI